MDLEKSKKDAQDQIDKTLAEVARLKTEAKRIEEENKTTLQKGEGKIAELQASISTLEDDALHARKTLESIKQEINDKEAVKKSVLNEIKARREDLIEMNKQISVKEDLLASIEKSGVEKVRKVDEKLEEKKAELRGLEEAIIETVTRYEIEENRLKVTLTKLKKEVREEEEKLTQKQKEVTLLSKNTKQYNREAEAAEAARKEAEKAVAKAGKELDLLVESIKESEINLSELKKEVENVNAELKTLNIKRMESKSFMDELQSKEANLRKKYEDVGLSYD